MSVPLVFDKKVNKVFSLSTLDLFARAILNRDFVVLCDFLSLRLSPQ